MAEPTPIYPDPDPRPEPGSQVVPIAPAGRSSFRYSNSHFLDRTLFQAGNSWRQGRHAAQSALQRLKRTATHVADEHPVHLVLGVAIAAFLAGTGLRIWRSYHE
jgi:hypothetical protein